MIPHTHCLTDQVVVLHPTRYSSFLQAWCPSCCPTNSVKALKWESIRHKYANNIYTAPKLKIKSKVHYAPEAPRTHRRMDNTKTYISVVHGMGSRGITSAISLQLGGAKHAGCVGALLINHNGMLEKNGHRDKHHIPYFMLIAMDAASVIITGHTESSPPICVGSTMGQTVYLHRPNTWAGTHNKQKLFKLAYSCTNVTRFDNSIWPNSVYDHTHTHPFNGPLSGTTRVSQYQKGKTNLDFTEARDSEWQWHQLRHMQVCNLLQTDNHASTPPFSFLQAGCPSCRPTNSVKALKALNHGRRGSASRVNGD